MFAPRVAEVKTNADEPERSKILTQRPGASRPAINEIDTNSSSRTGQPLSPLTWDFSRIPVFARSPGFRSPIQAKLIVGQVDDPLEHEADRLADRVMHLSHSSVSSPSVSSAASRPQFSRKWNAAPEAAAKGPETIIHEALRSPGQPLDAPTRAYFEPRFGHDFSLVRVHADQRAADAARSLAARAFTLNDHIVFGDHRYAPGSTTGRHLLAHELAHTIQQRTAPATPTIRRDPIPGWNFKPSDFARVQQAGVGITMAADSSFFPAKLQENLLKTIAFVLGPAIMPPATEGVNAVDFFHGHLVIKKDPKTADQAKAAEAKGDTFKTKLATERTKALGREVKFSGGYPLTDQNVGKYTKAVEKLLPSFGNLLDDTSKLPGAAIMYHTFEFNQPSDLKAQGKKLAAQDPRRHYVTPLDTNQPKQYSPPTGGYESEFTHITSFSFLVDDKGKVHVRPFGPDSGFTSLELSTITGTTFARTSEFEG